MIAPALRAIEREIETLAAEADQDSPVDPHRLRIIARKIACQAEMIEQGVDE